MCPAKKMGNAFSRPYLAIVTGPLNARFSVYRRTFIAGNWKFKLVFLHGIKVWFKRVLDKSSINNQLLATINRHSGISTHNLPGNYVTRNGYRQRAVSVLATLTCTPGIRSEERR